MKGQEGINCISFLHNYKKIIKLNIYHSSVHKSIKNMVHSLATVLGYYDRIQRLITNSMRTICIAWRTVSFVSLSKSFNYHCVRKRYLQTMIYKTNTPWLSNKWNDWCFMPLFCTCKAILGRGNLCDFQIDIQHIL